MGNNKTNTLQDFELALISADTTFYFELSKILENKEYYSILIYGLVPYISLFVHESSAYLRSKIHDFDALTKKQYESIIRASRIRTKLFDDDKKDISTQVEHLKWILDFWKKWMNWNHTGWLAPLQKLIQPDLGLWHYDKYIINSTLAGFFNMGYEKSDISVTKRGDPIDLDQLSFSFGHDLGQYAGILSVIFKVHQQPPFSLCEYQLDDNLFWYKDVKNKVYLSQLFNSNSTLELNTSLHLLTTSLNFLIRVFPKLIIGCPITWFKIKYLTLYHVTSSLKKLRDYYYPTGKLSETSKQLFASLVDRNELKSLVSQKTFRNLLVHYAIRDVPLNIFQTDIPLLGLVEHFFHGTKYDEINKGVDNQLHLSAKLLEKWETERYMK